MADGQGFTWGKVLKGVAIVTGVVAVAVGIGMGASALFPDQVATVLGVEITNKMATTAAMIGGSFTGIYKEVADGISNAFDALTGGGEVATVAEPAAQVLDFTALSETLEQVRDANVAGDLANAFNAVLNHAEAVNPELYQRVMEIPGFQEVGTQAHELQQAIAALDTSTTPGALKDAITAVREAAANLQGAQTQTVLEELHSMIANHTAQGVLSSEQAAPVLQSITDISANLPDSVRAADTLIESYNTAIEGSDVATSTAVKYGAAAAAATGVAAYGVGRRGGFKDGVNRGGAMGYESGVRDGSFAGRLQAQGAYAKGVQDGYAQMIRDQKEASAGQGMARGGAATGEA
jgi:hypothetical protein